MADKRKPIRVVVEVLVPPDSTIRVGDLKYQVEMAMQAATCQHKVPLPRPDRPDTYLAPWRVMAFGRVPRQGPAPTPPLGAFERLVLEALWMILHAVIGDRASRKGGPIKTWRESVRKIVQP